MSKAFTRESDDAPEPLLRPRVVPSLPPGAKNYLTPDGARMLNEELDHLTNVKRPPLAAAKADAESSRRLAQMDQRIAHLQRSILTAEIVPPPALPWDTVRFGATVTVREPGGAETRYRLVGVDETDLDRDWISWLSPIARALLNARLGQRLKFKFPAGEKELEIAGITYE
jgi:transcription elongation factor GreB